MKKIIFLVSALFIVFAGFCQNQPIKKEVIVTGTINGFYPPNYSGEVNLPFSYYNPKSEARINYSPSFQSADSFYLRLSLEQPKLVNVLFIPVYLVPGDSVHVEFKYTEDNEKRISKSWFSKVYSKLEYDGNAGYGSFIDSLRRLFLYQFEPKNRQYPALAIDSAYENLASVTQQYFKKEKVSPDYKKIIENDLLLLKVSKELDLARGDSMKIIQTLQRNRHLFRDDAYNSSSYFSAVGSIQGAFTSLYPNEPDKVLEKLKKYLDGETYLYASLIFSNVLRQKLPSNNNPYSSPLALNALGESKDQDLISFAKFILSQEKVGDKANAVLNKTRIMDYNGNIFTIEEVLKRNKSKLKYVDLWASWCGPCIEGIPFSKRLPEKFKGNEIQTFFISLDENIANWKNAHIRLGLQKEESYCIVDKENIEDFQEALRIIAIPRYLLLDSLNTIVLLQAPDPKNMNEKFISPFLQPKSDLISPIPPPPPPPMKK